MEKWLPILAAALLVGVMFCSCGGYKRADQTSVERADSLRTVLVGQDSLMDVAFRSISMMMNNVQAITAHERIVGELAPARMEQHVLDEIDLRMALTDSLLNVNKIIASATRRSIDVLRGQNVPMEDVDGLMAEIYERMNDAEARYATTKQELELAVVRQDTLFSDINGFRHESAVNPQYSNTAYYICDSQRNLLDDDIIYRPGFGDKPLLVNDTGDLTGFTKIDIRTFDRLKIFGQAPALVSRHPTGSYEFVRDNAGVLWLNILDQKQFWQTTKVLVVSFR